MRQGESPNKNEEGCRGVQDALVKRENLTKKTTETAQKGPKKLGLKEQKP